MRAKYEFPFYNKTVKYIFTKLIIFSQKYLGTILNISSVLNTINVKRIPTDKISGKPKKKYSDITGVWQMFFFSSKFCMTPSVTNFEQ